MFNRDIDTVISRFLVDKNQLWMVGILIVLRFLGTIIRISDSLKKDIIHKLQSHKWVLCMGS